MTLSVTRVLFAIVLITTNSEGKKPKLQKQTTDINGCPLFGCSPGGWFAVDLNVGPLPAVFVKWESEVFNASSLAQFQGCVGNSETIVCPLSSDSVKGYGGFDVDTGKLLWSDNLLVRPTLPLMDIYGDVIGSDGRKLVKYLVDGQVERPVIQLYPPMKNIYSLNLADNGILFITSADGVLTTYFTNGVPGGTIQLSYNVNNTHGIFYPITSPVIQGHRAYLLARFQADNNSSKVNGLLRLFAIDLNDSFENKIQVIWYVDLGESDAQFSPKRSSGHSFEKIPDAKNSNQDTESSVLVFNGIIFVTLASGNRKSDDFWAFADEGNLAFLVYKNSLSISDLCLQEDLATNDKKSKNFANDPGSKVRQTVSADEHTLARGRRGFLSRNQQDEFQLSEKNGANSMLWGINKFDNIIYGFNVSDSKLSLSVEICLNLTFSAPVIVTSKIMLINSKLNNSQSIVFGIQALSKTPEFLQLLDKFKISTSAKPTDKFMVGLTTDGSSSRSALNWMYPVPYDRAVRGQIIGIPASGYEKFNNLLVAYTVNEKSAMIIAFQFSSF